MQGRLRPTTSGVSDPAVRINVYDMTNNDSMYWCGLGIYHSGVEVYGCEYAFGAHDGPETGIFVMPPRQCVGDVRFRESVSMGRAQLRPAEVEKLIIELGQIFRGNRYHLLQRNCNHFTAAFVHALTGKRAPGWINRLAGFAVALHCLLPSTWLPPLEPPTATRTEGSTTSGSELHEDEVRHILVGQLSSEDHPRKHLVLDRSDVMDD